MFLPKWLLVYQRPTQVDPLCIALGGARGRGREASCGREKPGVETAQHGFGCLSDGPVRLLPCLQQAVRTLDCVLKGRWQRRHQSLPTQPRVRVPGESPTQGGAAPAGGYTLYQKLLCLRLGSGGLRPSSGQAREDSVGTETVKPLQTYPLTPFPLLRVLLTLEGSDANTVPANFDPSLAPQGPWMLSPR